MRPSTTNIGIDQPAIMARKKMSNHAINTDKKKRRSFVAPLFSAGYGER